MKYFLLLVLFAAYIYAEPRHEGKNDESMSAFRNPFRDFQREKRKPSILFLLKFLPNIILLGSEFRF